ncbi:glycosyltransferase, partial [Helicobacter sp. MIT 14-3879]|uniref:glycosyltransferase family 8 protein n=1 Tax=Helicobacter sp. MIT 14-3879 TaxID=2040649 RepID=UPI000E1E8CBE
YIAWYEKMPLSKWQHHTSCLRLSIPDIIPHNIDRILWLDCDMVVRTNLKEIFDIDMGNALAIVAEDKISDCRRKSSRQINWIGLDFQGYLDSIGLSKDAQLFNAGFLFINVKLWREIDIHRKFDEYVSKYHNALAYSDNDILNYVLQDKVKYISNYWNLIPSLDSDYYPTIPDLRDIHILHYAATKPLNPQCTDKFYLEEFWKYFFLTPYFKENPAEYINTIVEQKINAHNQNIRKLARALTCWIPIRKWRRHYRNKIFMQPDTLYTLHS